jgi:hypothetical protein
VYLPSKNKLCPVNLPTRVLSVWDMPDSYFSGWFLFLDLKKCDAKLGILRGLVSLFCILYYVSTYATSRSQDTVWHIIKAEVY